MAVPRMSWPLQRVESEDSTYDVARYDSNKEMIVETTSISSGSDSSPEVIGSTDIFDEFGNIRLIPVS